MIKLIFKVSDGQIEWDYFIHIAAFPGNVLNELSAYYMQEKLDN